MGLGGVFPEAELTAVHVISCRSTVLHASWLHKTQAPVMERRGGWWRVRDGTAVLEQPGSAAPLHLLSPRQLCLSLLWSSPLQELPEESQSWWARERGIGFVGSVSCSVLFFIIYCSAVAVDAVTCFLVSAEYAMVQ